MNPLNLRGSEVASQYSSGKQRGRGEREGVGEEGGEEVYSEFEEMSVRTEGGKAEGR